MKSGALVSPPNIYPPCCEQQTHFRSSLLSLKMHLRKQSKTGYNTMGNVVIEGKQIYLFTTFLVHVKSDANVQFFFSFALDCKDWVNALFTIFASRANSIQQWNLPRGKHKQIWSNVVFTSYSHWFCSCCKSIFFEQCCKHSCHSHALILSP